MFNSFVIILLLCVISAISGVVFEAYDRRWAILFTSMTLIFLVIMLFMLLIKLVASFS